MIIGGGLTGAAVSGAMAGTFAAEYAKEVKKLKIDAKQVGKLRKVPLPL